MYNNDDLLLFTPGPVQIAPRVLRASGRPMLHHRTQEFQNMLTNVITGMKVLFGTQGDVLLLHTSGRGGMEGALRNIFCPGDKLLCVCNGKFGDMFAEIAEFSGFHVQRIFERWLTPVDVPRIDAILESDPAIKGVTVVHSDTSTGVLNPVEEIGRVVRKHDRLLLVDCISSLGAMAFKTDDWKVDVAVTASQKGLMAGAGLSFVAINERAWQAAERGAVPGYYVNFANIKEFYDQKHQTPGSTPVSLVMAVNESLDMIFEEGPENVYRRHHIIAAAVRKAVEAMGLTVLPPENVGRTDCLTLLETPEGVDPNEVKERAKTRYGILLASGLGHLKNSALRIGHLGTVTPRDALLAVSILEVVLFEMKRIDRPGKGVEAFSAQLQALWY